MDQNDGPAKQDKELRLENINKVKDSLDDESTKTYAMLASVLDKHKEVRDEYERDREVQGCGDPTPTHGPSLKLIDTLKLLDHLKHTANCFEYHSWHDQAEAWSQSSNFSVATPAVQKAFF